MKYRAIIADAWGLTKSNKRLMWWFAFVPALLTMLVVMIYAVYQFLAFWTSPYFNKQAEGDHGILAIIAKAALQFFNEEPTLAVLLIVVAAILGLLYLILPVFTQGALIQLVARIRGGHPVSVREGISFGFTRFLQLFEYHLLIKTFSFVSIVTEAMFVLRNLGPKAFAIFGWFFLVVFLVGLLLTLLFTYSEYYIVIDRQGVFKSMLKSGGLVLRQWHHTLFMLLLMAIIIVRVALNVLAAVLIPAIVIVPAFIFASAALAKIGVIVGVLIALVLFYFSSYFLGIFHLFATAVWTFTFLELTSVDSEEVDLRKSAAEPGTESAEEEV